MNDFALITEGITDQVTIEAILAGFYEHELDINPIQPLRDSTDASRQAVHVHGGWERVLDRCEQDDFVDIFSANNYLIIQIDTDQGEHPRYNVPLTQGGNDRPPLEIIGEVEGLIKSKIGTARFERYGNRIIFAIAVHSTDCWFLPIYSSTKAHKIKTKNCANTLNHILTAKGEKYIKDFHFYSNLAKRFEDKASLESTAVTNLSLDRFINNLPVSLMTLD